METKEQKRVANLAGGVRTFQDFSPLFAWLVATANKHRERKYNSKVIKALLKISKALMLASCNITRKERIKLGGEEVAKLAAGGIDDCVRDSVQSIWRNGAGDCERGAHTHLGPELSSPSLTREPRLQV